MWYLRFRFVDLLSVLFFLIIWTIISLDKILKLIIFFEWLFLIKSLYMRLSRVVFYYAFSFLLNPVYLGPNYIFTLYFVLLSLDKLINAISKVLVFCLFLVFIFFYPLNLRMSNKIWLSFLSFQGLWLSVLNFCSLILTRTSFNYCDSCSLSVSFIERIDYCLNIPL